MSLLQEAWCTPETVQIYVRARPGDLPESARLLAKALCWRQEHKDVLTGMRLPVWQGDMRVVARGVEGHPIIIMHMGSQPDRTDPKAIADHVAAVLEAAVTSACNGAQTFDAVCDCRGFQLQKNLDPRPLGAVFTMLKHPYRSRLRHGFVVDAPRAFGVLWKMARGIMAPA